MALLKRTFTGLYATIDRLVGEIENHDALIQAAIAEQKKKLAAAKVQLRRVQAHEKQLKEQIAQCSIDERRWSQRATRAAGEDEHKALACLQRRQRVRAQKDKLQTMQREYHQSAEAMQANITHCEQELADMVQKHELFRARQSTADAMDIVGRAGASDVEDIASSFDRWEVRIAQGELLNDAAPDVDELEQEYVSQEHEAQLREELAELLKEQKLEDDLR